MLNRKCKNIKILLPEFVEGVLAPEDKKLVEVHIVKCDNCLSDISEIKHTLNLLQFEAEKKVPINYFSTLPALIRERLEKKKEKFTIPIFWFRYAHGLAAMLVVGIISTLYILLSDKGSFNGAEEVNLYSNILELENQTHLQLIESNYYIPNETEAILNNRLTGNLQNFSSKKLSKMNKMDLELTDFLAFLVEFDNQSKSEFDYLLAVSEEISNEAIH